MLKIVKTSLLVISASLLWSTMAQADVSDDLQNLCAIDKTDDRGELRKKVKIVNSHYTTSLQRYSGDISCSAESLLPIALASKTMEAGTLLVKKLPKGDLAASEQDSSGVYAVTLQKIVTGSAIDNSVNDSI